MAAQKQIKMLEYNYYAGNDPGCNFVHRLLYKSKQHSKLCCGSSSMTVSSDVYNQQKCNNGSEEVSISCYTATKCTLAKTGIVNSTS